jgi:steroid Delta-isomerase
LSAAASIRVRSVPALRRSIRGALLAAALGLAACAAPSAPDLAALNASYAAALARTAPLAADFPPGSPAERAALDRVQTYFRSVTPASVAAGTAATYAPAAYLNDTVAAVDGALAIERYFAGSARRTQAFGVEFLDTARTGTDYYVRWKMTVVADGLNDGAPVLTYGVTQFRFDSDGRVLIHKDFWDAGTGLYEQLPGIGGIIRRIRSAAHDS